MMGPDPHEKILPWQHQAVAEPVHNTSNLEGSYCNGRSPMLRESRSEEGNHINYYEGYGSYQAGCTWTPRRSQRAQYTGQVMRVQTGYRYDQSYDLSSSSCSGNQLQCSDPGDPDPTSSPPRVTCSVSASSMHPIQYPSHLWQPVSHVPETDHVPSDDADLQALDFPDDFSLGAVKQFSPIQRRIQAFGATMDENDWMQSQQPVIVSKYFRNTKDATYFKSVRDTGHWQSVKDDPAFADITTHGAIVAFEELYQRKEDDILLSYSVAEAYRRQSSHLSTASDIDQHDYQNFPPQQAVNEAGLSIEQEERLAALGVTGDPKPLTQPRIPKKEECRSRSRSPETTRQPKQNASYRQRRKRLGAAMSNNESGRNNVEPGFQQRDQENQNRGQGQARNKTEEKSRQQQQHSRKASRKATRRQRQRQRRQVSRPKSSNNASTKALESSPRRTSQVRAEHQQHLKKRKDGSSAKGGKGSSKFIAQ